MLVVTTYNDEYNEEVLGQWYAITIILPNQKEFRLYEKGGRLEIGVSGVNLSQLNIRPKSPDHLSIGYDQRQER